MEPANQSGANTKELALCSLQVSLRPLLPSPLSFNFAPVKVDELTPTEVAS